MLKLLGKKIASNIKLVSFMGYLITAFIYKTNRKKFLNLPAIPIDQPIIVLFWHEHLLMSLFHYKKLRSDKKNAEVFAMISDHRDGEFIARTVEHFGIGSIRGSSSRGGVKALLTAIKHLKNSQDIAFTPDGPRGPRHSIADGVIMAAQKSGAKLIALSYKSSRCWRLNSWDKFVIPKPFGTIYFKSSDLFDISNLSNDEAKRLIGEKLATQF